jgi:DNA-binding NarL/FixJ family response regulator
MSKKKNKPTVATNLTAEQQEIAQMEAALAAKRSLLLEQQKTLAAELKTKVEGIPTMLGVADIASAIKLIRKISRPVGSGRKSKITDETRAKVAEMVAAGKTGAEIAKETKLSVPTIQKIKSALGLVRVRV